MGRTPSIVRAETLCPAAEAYDDEIRAAPAGAILTDELVHRVERTLAHDAATVISTMRAIDPTSDASVVPRAGGVLAHTGRGLPINRAMGMGIGLAVDASDLDAVVDFFDKRRMPAEIELCPFADDGLRARSSERGFSVAWFRSVCTRSIAKIELAPKSATTFERVDDRATFVQWAALHRAMQRALASGPAGETFDQLLVARHAMPGANDFLVRRGDVTVGVCSVTVHERAATLTGMAVFPDFRERGVHTDAIAFRLGVARDLGCDLAIMTAAPGSSAARNAERAGCTPRYTSVCLRRPR